MKRKMKRAMAREQLSGSGRRHAHAPARRVRISESLKKRLRRTRRLEVLLIVKTSENQIPAKNHARRWETLPIPHASVQIVRCTGVVFSTVTCIVDSCMRLIVIICDTLTRSGRVHSRPAPHALPLMIRIDRIHACFDAL